VKLKEFKARDECEWEGERSAKREPKKNVLFVSFSLRVLRPPRYMPENETIGLTLRALHVSLFILLNTSNEY
jgi:hypothetical protein